MTGGNVTDAATRGGTARVLRLAPCLALGLAIAAVVLLALAPLGWRAGWWGYRPSLLTLMPYAAYFGLAAVAVALLSLLFAGRAIAGRGVALALAALLAGGVCAFVPWHFRQVARSVPRIDDITTDTGHPPAFVAILPLRQAAHANPSTYPGGKTAALQKQGYPDIAPLRLPLPADKAFALALRTAQAMGWTVVAGDPAAGRIEADARSFWMGFTDDIVLRIAAADAGSRIDMRSASRYGRSDLGVNAARIRAYLTALRNAASD